MGKPSRSLDPEKNNTKGVPNTNSEQETAAQPHKTTNTTKTNEWEHKAKIPKLTGRSIPTKEEYELLTRRAKTLVEEEAEEPDTPEKETASEQSLEETIANEPLNPQQLQAAQPDTQPHYGQVFSQEPASALYNRVRELQEAINTQGFITSEQQQQLTYFSGAINEKLEDVQTGEYVPPNEQVKTLIGHVKSMLQSLYQGKERLERGADDAKTSQDYQSGR